MADAIYPAGGLPCNTDTDTIVPFSLPGDLPGLGQPYGLLHPDLVDTRACPPDIQFALLTHLEENGSSAIEDLVSAIPGWPLPVAAILDLVAAGAVVIDPSDRFDRHMRICLASTEASSR